MRELNYESYYWQNDKVRLRSIEIDDWENHYYNSFDSAARRMLQYELELPPTVEENKSAMELFKDFNPKSNRIMFTIENLDGENVGAINLNSIDEKNGNFSIGMQIDRDHRAKGYGTAAMMLLLNYAFNERRLNKFNASVIDGNVGSATMLKKLGSLQEGVRRETIYTEGKFFNEILYGLTKKDFNDKFYR